MSDRLKRWRVMPAALVVALALTACEPIENDFDDQGLPPIEDQFGDDGGGDDDMGG